MTASQNSDGPKQSQKPRDPDLVDIAEATIDLTLNPFASTRTKLKAVGTLTDSAFGLLGKLW